MFRFKTLVGAVVVCLLCSCGLHVQAKNETIKVGVVDPDKILEQYSKAQVALKELADAETKLKKRVQAKRKQISEAKEQNKTDTEIQMLIEQFKIEIEPEAKRLEAESKSKGEAIEKEIKDAIGNVAKEQKLDVVLIKPAVLYGGTDISSSVVNKLPKAKK